MEKAIPIGDTVGNCLVEDTFVSPVEVEELETAGSGTRVTNPTIVGTYGPCTYFPCAL